MNRNHLYIRCDGGPVIGMGHVFRCIALAQMLEEQFQITFLVQAEQTVQETITQAGFTCIILPTTDTTQEGKNLRSIIPTHASLLIDGYAFDHAYQASILDHVASLICIDDLCRGPYVADLIINHAPGMDESLYDLAPHSRALLGLPYAILRKAFLTYSAHEPDTDQKHVLISLGASDYDNLNQAVISKLQAELREVKITVLTSAANKNLNALLGAQTESLQVVVQVSAEEVAHLMSRVSLIICTASTAAIEACAVGVPMVVGYSAENQRGIYQGMMQLNACIGIGSFHNMDDDALLSAVRILLDSKEESQRMVQRQRIAIDQQSNHRITEAIHRTQQQAESFWWREVRQQDMMLLFEWTNDPEVRANSFQSEPINLETHERWFKGILENDHAAFFLFFQGRTPIGQLRLVKRDGLCALSYSVSKSSRGKGFGKAILKSSLPLASQCWQDVQEIVGYVKPTNEASQRAFLALGFSIKESNPDEILFAHAL